VKKIGLACINRGISHLTLFAFSTENWKRSEEEVSYLMDLLYSALTKELSFFEKHDIRIRVIGRRAGLSSRMLKAIDEAETRTSGHARGQLNLCINYGGRAEIIDGIKRLIEQGVPAEEITEETFGAGLWMTGIPDPDLIIRTSGEQRLSGFLTWSGVYSELLFVEKHWPDFDEEILDAALAEYEGRRRRYGK
jgi:undecaprenyl diphosphate synthase